MSKRMMCDNPILRKKGPFLFVIKIVLWLFISYFIIQLSIGAKETEEKKNIPGLQTTMEVANYYIQGKYKWDWEKFGSRIVYPNALAPSCYLELLSDAGTLLVSPLWGEDFQITQTGIKKSNNEAGIWIFYKSDLNIKVTANYTRYYLEYENGQYIQNPQMEQEIGFTTEEIVEQADKMRNAFEEEMEKMHQYQIGRAKERRKKFTNFGFTVFLFLILTCLYLKWISINRRADIEDKYPEEVLEETIVKEKEKFLKRRYLLIGCGMAFWIYMLIPVVSEYLLLPLEGTTKEYAAYGISAIITAAIFGLFWKSLIAEKRDMADTGKQVLKSIFQYISGCIATLIIIQLGVVLVPRFYTFEWRFYKINLLADGAAFLIFSVIIAVKKLKAGTGNSNIEFIEKEDFM